MAYSNTIGTIVLQPLNSYGNAALGERSMYHVWNGGRNAWETAKFIRSIAKHLVNSTDGYLIEQGRIEKFTDFCERNGFTVEIRACGTPWRSCAA